MTVTAEIPLAVGIDVGGTKTRIIAERDGMVLLDTTVATTSWQRGELIDDENNAGRLLHLFAAIAGSRFASVAVGAHGLDSQAQAEVFQDRLASRHQGRVQAVNDVELLAPAAGRDEAIAVVVGTGSKIVGHTAAGELITAGGHGFLFSDPGSSPGLAREAVKAVLDAYDDGTPPDLLGRSLMNYFHVDDVVALSYAFSGDIRLSAWGALGPLVFSSAAQGSTIANTVIDDAARLLARDVGRLHSRGAAGNVICAGGVISNQPRLFTALEHHIHALELGLSVELLSVSPVQGALALARKPVLSSQ